MDKLLINGGNRLNGKVFIDSSKNSMLPIIAATLLTEEEVVLKNIPTIIDVKKMFDIVTSLGGHVNYMQREKTVVIKNDNISSFEIPPDLTSDIRSSIFMLGPIVSKYKKAKVSYPGGCDIGSRPIDLHLFGLKELGVKIVEDYGYIICDGTDMRPGIVHLDFPSVGATENIMMAAVLLKGQTTILNPAKEPEILDLQNFINKLGGKIEGAGTNKIVITGVDKLGGCEYTPIPDRIVAGTFMIAAAITRGKIVLENVNYEHVFSLINKLRKSGCNIDFNNGIICVESNRRPHACSFETQPYPGFPTDLQPQLSVLQTVSKGISIVTENLFETRFRHLQELSKMGASVTFRDRTAIIKGVGKLHAANIIAYDLRGGAALVLAGLVAKGRTTINNIKYIDRGYDGLEIKLNQLGADIERTK